MATRELRIVDDGRAGICPGSIVLFRPAPSFVIPLFDLEAYVYVCALAATRGLQVVGDEPAQVIPVDDMHLTSDGNSIGAHPDMWAEVWHTTDREP